MGDGGEKQPNGEEENFWDSILKSTPQLPNKSLQIGHPLTRLPHIPMAENANAVSFNEILRTGNIHADIGNKEDKNQSIDFSIKDAYTEALQKIENKALIRIYEDHGLQDLLHQDNWSIFQRETWEGEVSRIVSNEMRNTPGFENYRIEQDGTERSNTLNNLAKDLSGYSEKIRWSCEEMSATLGVILQKIENRLLPSQPSSPENLKAAGEYYYVPGAVLYDLNESYGGHAFIASAPTGNIIESTTDKFGSPYRSTNNSFIDLIVGENVASNKGVYGSPFSNGDEYIARQRRASIELEDFGNLSNLRYSFDFGTQDSLAETYAVNAIKNAKDDLRAGTPAEVDLPENHPEQTPYMELQRNYAPKP